MNDKPMMDARVTLTWRMRIVFLFILIMILVLDYMGKGKQYIFYIDDKPYTIKQLMIIYGMTRSQIDYRIRNNKELPDGRTIQRVDMQELFADVID